MAGTLEDRVNHVLAQAPELVNRKLESMYDQLVGNPDCPMVLFGAGGWLGRDTLLGLSKLGIRPICLSDNNPSLWGTRIHNIEVVPPREAVMRHGQSAAFVVTIFNGSVPRQQLKDLGCKTVISYVPLFFKYHGTFLPYYGLDFPQSLFEQSEQVRAGLLVWADERSKQDYVGQLEWITTLDGDGLSRPMDPAWTYFAPELVPFRTEDTFIDCGAYDGDTLSGFLAHHQGFREYVAFEPDPTNFLAFEAYVSSLPVEIRGKVKSVNGAVGAAKGGLFFSATGSPVSKVSTDGQIEVPCYLLDEYLASCESAYIKMDIEGSELAALAGAEKSIRKGTHVLAIAMYHRQDDLWRIPLYISSLSRDYRLYLRRYAEDKSETVCYAIPKDRVVG